MNQIVSFFYGLTDNGQLSEVNHWESNKNCLKSIKMEFNFVSVSFLYLNIFSGLHLLSITCCRCSSWIQKQQVSGRNMERKKIKSNSGIIFIKNIQKFKNL